MLFRSAFSCARNIVIVGDLKQLSNVLTEDDIRTSDAIWQKYSLDERYRFSTHSLLSSALEIWQDAPATLLREHYRCHPKIINFCNQKFYHGQLIVMTKDHDEPNVLTMYRTTAGKTASDIRVVRPLEDGVISDYEVTEQMLKHFFAKVNPSRVFKPRVCVCVPSAITEVESRSVIDTVMSSGARNVYLIEEPVAAAIGAGMDITRPGGIVVLDIGGGTSDIAVLSLNGIVCKSSVKMAGNKMNAAIVRYVRSTYNVLIGDSTADRVKREIGTVWTEGQPEKTVEVKGRNLVTGLPQKITLSSYELEMPLRIEVERIITALQSVMEQTPPELVADIEKNGLLMTGGGAMLDGLDKLITSRVRIRAHLAENPIEAVAIGTGKSFEYLGKLYDGFVSYTNYSSR